MRSVTVCRVAVVLALCLLIPACKSKVNKANFEKVKDGMTLEEVEKVLGKGTKEAGDGSNVAGQFGVAVTPASTDKSVETYKWENQSSAITVSLRDGKVVSKRSTGF